MDYRQSLNGLVLKRYQLKMEMCDGIDPFTISVSDNVADVPALSAFDVVTYLTTITSYYTGNQAKAYKSLDAYKFHEAKYGHGLLMKKITNKTIIVGKVIFPIPKLECNS